MKFYDFDLEAVKFDGDKDADGEVRFSFSMAGVNNVATVVRLWDSGKALLESYKQKEVNVLSLVTLVGTLYESFIKKAK